MGKITAFIFVSLDGYYKGPNEDISWHHHEGEANAFAAEMLRMGSTLMFGRVTYQMMESFWTSPEAGKIPDVAAGMNKADKIVFSKTLKEAKWQNSRVVSGDIIAEVRRLKDQGKNLTLLGSGDILTQLADADVIDEYQIMVNPVILGEGSSAFKGLHRRKNLKLSICRTLDTGVVYLSYISAK